MTCKGKVSGGVVLLEDPRAFQEGTEVRVVAARRPRKRKLPALEGLRATLLRHAGKGRRLPPDLAKNHDYYIHGTARKE